MQGRVSEIERRSPAGVMGHDELFKARAGLGVSALRPGVNLPGISCSSEETESLPTLGYRQLYLRLAHLEQLGLDSSH